MPYYNQRTGQWMMSVAVPVEGDNEHRSLTMLAQTLGVTVGEMFSQAVKAQYQRQLHEIEGIQKRISAR